MKVKFVHTNIVARDWKKLVRFYIDVFQCQMKLPQRNLQGEWLDQATGLDQAHIKGMHLSLPGYKPGDGPTLEIFQYTKNEKNENRPPNKEGLGHIAFSVDQVDECLQLIKDNGGGLIGRKVRTEIEGVGMIHFAYAHDPEGNIIEIQKWH